MVFEIKMHVKSTEHLATLQTKDGLALRIPMPLASFLHTLMPNTSSPINL
jgi:hypothetical protein